MFFSLKLSTDIYYIQHFQYQNSQINKITNKTSDRFIFWIFNFRMFYLAPDCYLKWG